MQTYAAALGELERIGQEVLEHLQNALGVGGDAAAEVRIEAGGETQLARLGFVAEIAFQRLFQMRELQILALHRHGAGLDLRQVENVADQVEKIGARAVN